MSRKNLGAVVLLFVMFSFSCFISFTSIKAETKNTVNRKWTKAYMKTIKKAQKEAQKRGILYDYDLIYFNKDDIPELILGPQGAWISMYTYDKKKNKVYRVMKQWGYGMGSGAYTYIPKKNILMQEYTYYAGHVEGIYCGKMKNNKIKSVYSKDLKIFHFIDKNNNALFDEGENYIEKSFYYYGNKKISEKKYNSYIPSGKRKMLMGTMSFEEVQRKIQEKGA